MTLSQLITLNNSSEFRELRVDDGILFAKELLGEHKPYSVRKAIDGTDVILFNSHFINCMRQALSDGCVARMSKQELKFWLKFVSYQDDIQDGTRNHPDSNSQVEYALEELSRWMTDELAGIEHEETKECYIPYIEES